VPARCSQRIFFEYRSNNGATDMTSNLFSAYRASEILERDRQTIIRALRHIKPDGKEHGGQPRWKMRTILDAMSAHEGITGRVSSRGSTAKHERADFSQRNLDRIYAEFDTAFEVMTKVKSLEKRREISLKTLAPIIDEHQIAMHEHALITNDEFVTGLLNDKLYTLMLAGFQHHCSWSHEETWTLMAQAMSSYVDE
jgi:hypothetical protein